MNPSGKRTTKIIKEHVSDWIKEVYRDKTAGGWNLTANSEICLQALEAWRDYKSSCRDIRRILNEMHQSGISSIEEFERIEKKFHDGSPNVPDQDWLFIVPFQIQFDPNLCPLLQFCGYNFSFWNRDQVVAKIGKPKKIPYDLRLDKILQANSYQSYIVTGIRGGDFNESWFRLSKTFDALLGLLELNFNCGNQKWGWGSGGAAHTIFPRPKWLISFTEELGPSLGWFLTEYGDYEEKPTKPVSQKKYNTLVANAALMADAPSPGSIHALLMTGLILYAQSLDGRLPHTRLLGLWQLAETLTLSDRFGGKTELVCNRLLAFDSLFGFNQNALRTVLQNIATMRNDFVHRGLRHQIEDRHVNALKLTTESLLLQLSSVADKIKTVNALEYYYQLHSKSASEISALRHTVAFLRSSKRVKKIPKDGGN